MQRPHLVLVILAAAGLAAASPVAADPRMETNDNFCHFIMDHANTDNEVFLAGCDCTIVTVEPPPPADMAKIACESAVASGYGERTVVMPQAAIGIPARTKLTFTSADSDTPCTMVESNGRAYQSHNWTSTIRVEATRRRGEVRVRYTLQCLDGRL
jgi:hypothetical protein